MTTIEYQKGRHTIKWRSLISFYNGRLIAIPPFVVILVVASYLLYFHTGDDYIKGLTLGTSIMALILLIAWIIIFRSMMKISLEYKHYYYHDSHYPNEKTYRRITHSMNDMKDLKRVGHIKIPAFTEMDKYILTKTGDAVFFKREDRFRRIIFLLGPVPNGTSERIIEMISKIILPSSEEISKMEN